MLDDILKGRIDVGPVIEVEIDPKEQRNDVRRPENSDYVSREELPLFFLLFPLIRVDQNHQVQNREEARHNHAGKQRLEAHGFIFPELENAAEKRSDRPD